MGQQQTHAAQDVCARYGRPGSRRASWETPLGAAAAVVSALAAWVVAAAWAASKRTWTGSFRDFPSWGQERTHALQQNSILYSIQLVGSFAQGVRALDVRHLLEVKKADPKFLAVCQVDF
jgi:hypothetical protein